MKIYNEKNKIPGNKVKLKIIEPIYFKQYNVNSIFSYIVTKFYYSSLDIWEYFHSSTFLKSVKYITYAWERKEDNFYLAIFQHLLP
jgi:hypothetical protein